MSTYTTTTTFDTTGIKTITPGFQSAGITVDVAPASGAAFTGIQFCSGWTDGTRKKCDSIYFNHATTAAKSEKSTSKLVRLFGEDGSGNIIVVLEAVLDSVTATQVKFNVTIASIDYQVSIKCQS